MNRRRTAVGLSARDRGVLELERKWGQSVAMREAKLEEARVRLGLSPSGYMLVLTSLIDDPMARAEDPEIVARLRQARGGDGSDTVN